MARTCGLCHKPGHNARTCPTSPTAKFEAGKIEAAPVVVKAVPVVSVKPSGTPLMSVQSTETFCPINEDTKHRMEQGICNDCGRYNPSVESIARYKRIQTEKVAAMRQKDY